MEAYLMVDSGWQAMKASEVQVDGKQFTSKPLPTDGLPAIVPGTILTTLLDNDMIKDPEGKVIKNPYYGLNNKDITDISTPSDDTDKNSVDLYTYWFYTNLKLSEAPTDDGRIWLMFRGINYQADVFFNGHKLNDEPLKGMFIRRAFDITK